MCGGCDQSKQFMWIYWFISCSLSLSSFFVATGNTARYTVKICQSLNDLPMINKAIIFGAVCVGCPICICQNLLGKYRQYCGVCAVGVTNLNNSCAFIDSFLVLCLCRPSDCFIHLVNLMTLKCCFEISRVQMCGNDGKRTKNLPDKRCKVLILVKYNNGHTTRQIQLNKLNCIKNFLPRMKSLGGMLENWINCGRWINCTIWIIWCWKTWIAGTISHRKNFIPKGNDHGFVVLPLLCFMSTTSVQQVTLNSP